MKTDILEELDSKARQSKQLGRFAEAMTLRQELERHQDQIVADPAERAKNLNQLAFVAAIGGDPSEAVRAAQKCLSNYMQVPKRRDETLATYVMMLAYVLAESGRFCEAVAYGEEALELFMAIYGKENDFVVSRAKDIQCMRIGEARSYLER